MFLCGTFEVICANQIGKDQNYYFYGSTNIWVPRVKNKSFGWAANRNQPQHRLKFVVTITQ